MLFEIDQEFAHWHKRVFAEEVKLQNTQERK